MTTKNNLKSLEQLEREVERLKAKRHYQRVNEQMIEFAYIMVYGIFIFLSIVFLQNDYNGSIHKLFWVFYGLVVITFIRSWYKFYILVRRVFFNEDSPLRFFQNRHNMLRNISTEELPFKLEEAVKSEDYILASAIKKELDKRKK